MPEDASILTVGSISRVLFLLDYNTRLVVLSATLLGLGCGTMGSFLMLRKRSLIGDSLSHATLPGIAMAFMIMVSMGGSGKWLPGLLLGALLSGIAGYLSVLWIRKNTRVKDDAAMGVVLSVFFGAGVSLLGIVQAMPGGSAAGLESFIYGKTASIVMGDFLLLGGISLFICVVAVLFFKELKLLCFDSGFAESQGFPSALMDQLLLGLVAVMIVAGLQAVGLILVIALLITPAAASRFWSNQLEKMVLLSAAFGAASCWIGAALSALVPDLPAGALIVLVAAAFFGFSLAFGCARGVVWRWLRQQSLQKRILQQHLLRASYQWLENPLAPNEGAIPVKAVQNARYWKSGELMQCIRMCQEVGHLDRVGKEHFRLTPVGLELARRTTRNHRLWEIYLIEHADIAVSHVDRDADAVEHILGEEMVHRLEQHLWKYRQDAPPTMPQSPHD